MGERALDSDDAGIGSKVATLVHTFASALAGGPPSSKSGYGPKRSA